MEVSKVVCTPKILSKKISKDHSTKTLAKSIRSSVHSAVEAEQEKDFYAGADSPHAQDLLGGKSQDDVFQDTPDLSPKEKSGDEEDDDFRAIKKARGKNLFSNTENTEEEEEERNRRRALKDIAMDPMMPGSSVSPATVRKGSTVWQTAIAEEGVASLGEDSEDSVRPGFVSSYQAVKRRKEGIDAKEVYEPKFLFPSTAPLLERVANNEGFSLLAFKGHIYLGKEVRPATGAPFYSASAILVPLDKIYIMVQALVDMYLNSTDHQSSTGEQSGLFYISLPQNEWSVQTGISRNELGEKIFVLGRFHRGRLQVRSKFTLSTMEEIFEFGAALYDVVKMSFLMRLEEENKKALFAEILEMLEVRTKKMKDIENFMELVSENPDETLDEPYLKLLARRCHVSHDMFKKTFAIYRRTIQALVMLYVLFKK